MWPLGQKLEILEYNRLLLRTKIWETTIMKRVLKDAYINSV